MRPRASDHLICDWLQLTLAGFTEFKITDMQRELRISRSRAKHKVTRLIRAGLVEANRMESIYMIYKLNSAEGIEIGGGI